MDELAIRTLLNSLDASRSSLHVLLHIFTGFVVVGLGVNLFVQFDIHNGHARLNSCDSL